jgi:hypothetical protein
MSCRRRPQNALAATADAADVFLRVEREAQGLWLRAQVALAARQHAVMVVVGILGDEQAGPAVADDADGARFCRSAIFDSL